MTLITSFVWFVIWWIVGILALLCVLLLGTFIVGTIRAAHRLIKRDRLNDGENPDITLAVLVWMFFFIFGVPTLIGFLIL